MLWPNHVSWWVVGETLYIAIPIAVLMRAPGLKKLLKAMGVKSPAQISKEGEPPSHS